ncbi:MAG: integrase arm-type DNA-binding domain-containing protein [Oxalobacter sp.]|nr:integrase arm-type DNA-binding domain-containing protein [Oxalobacter sp.]
MAKIIKPLSPMQVKNAKPREKNYKLFDGGGLYLEVTPNGSKLWRMKFRQANRKENRLSFGRFPDISLEQARQKRDEARKLRAAGIDPAENKKAIRDADSEKASNTFEKIAREWHSNRLETWQPNTARDILHRLEKDIFPESPLFP